eukprot:Plantae.Rhodophyta-Hildenbrandia_rubra.ctg12282.p1 GENE.Plantae.Rhodophyta-Hildenbrandia_rubra.ctg12282~~Plantae.Rhodophyta-Hildenbrandia_rubra.ctg12282.p1  ORF type:complete len:474 (-),score=62.38 Plantae.Rhodophyta-Hildenbrandia_rubra.ctg12282:2376-3797(-)
MSADSQLVSATMEQSKEVSSSFARKTLYSAETLDAEDVLADYRSQFSLINGGETIYLCSHSLGLMPRQVPEDVGVHLQKWAKRGVMGHVEEPDPWVRMEDKASFLSLELVGAHDKEIVYMNGLSVNLHLMLSAFYNPQREGRFQILIEEKAFSSDDYVVQTHVERRGYNADAAVVRISPRDGEMLLREEDIVDRIRKLKRTLALVLLPGVQYYTGQVLPIKRICKAAHECGIVVGLDLAHAVGNVELKLHDWDVDFACWCSYKYLCGGPGAVAGVFVHEKHSANRDLKRLGGWWGHERKSRFELGQEFVPQQGAYGFQLSNVPVLSLIPVATSLEIFQQAGMNRIRAKSVLMSTYFDLLVNEMLGSRVSMINSEKMEDRGCQISLRLMGGVSAHAVTMFLEEHGVICDYRHPDVMRIAPSPLYNTFGDIRQCVVMLKKALDSGSQLKAGRSLSDSMLRHGHSQEPNSLAKVQL